MTYSVSLPLSGYSGWTFLKRTQDRQMAALAKDPQVTRDEAYFRSRIQGATTAEALVKDKRLLRVALRAFGLEGDVGKTYFITKVLAEGTDASTDLANKLSDKRYAQLTDAFGFADGTPATTDEGFADRILQLYREQTFEKAVGDVNSSFRTALFAETQLPNMAASTSSERTKWYSVIGSTALSEVFQTALGLSSSFGALDVDLQVDMLQRKSRQVLGSSSVSQFSDPAKVEKLMKLYLVRTQIAEGVTTTSTAVTLLQNASSGFLSRY